MKEVFISYSRLDVASVELIVRRLAGRGHTVWWDRQLVGGDDFGMAIEAALVTSSCAVVAWSKAARHSLWVRAEANSARESGKLVQLTLDGTSPPLPFSMLHALDFRRDDGSPDAPPMQELLRSVTAIASGDSRTEVAQGGVSTSMDLAGFGRVAAIGCGSLGLVVLAAALAIAAPHQRPSNLLDLAYVSIFLLAVLGFAHLVVKVILALLASRRR